MDQDTPQPRRRSPGEMARRGFAAEALIVRLFEALDYEVEVEPLVGGVYVDLIATKNLRPSFVEVKGPFVGPVNLGRIRETAARLEAVARTDPLAAPIIVVLGHLSPAARDWAEGQYHLQIWDLDRVLDLAARDEALHADLLALVSETPAAPLPEPAAELSETARLIAVVEAHIKKNTLTPSGYEALCMEVFTHVFDPVLFGFKNQVQTVDGGNRYDFICQIKSGDPFWDGLRHDFRTRAIVFECKNYAKKITADQVYSTERYLFANALRTVCILISRLGPDDGCRRAAQGAMRESGKLILLLSNTDLVELLKLRSTPGGPAEYLDALIWQFIVSLPR